MILPIYAYGQPVLKQVAKDIAPDYPGLSELIANMWDTMYNASGVGLAAPQVGLSVRLFVIDTIQIMDEGKEAEGLKRVFINAQKVSESGNPWAYEEGCLSIPEVRGDVDRPPTLHLRWLDEHFQPQEAVFTGINARVIQHEYDHIDGVLFVEHLKPVKKRLVRRKLEDVRKGKAKADYKLKFIGK
ncbi:MAG TPA: peptide deformylase [Saprospiraceae bacterium]|nr:peptide deformylase [Saprospiraceae bacterium]HMP25816.1 peptide deformylase [Saprospiraceae bacterium]